MIYVLYHHVWELGVSIICAKSTIPLLNILHLLNLLTLQSRWSVVFLSVPVHWSLSSTRVCPIFSCLPQRVPKPLARATSYSFSAEKPSTSARRTILFSSFLRVEKKWNFLWLLQFNSWLFHWRYLTLSSFILPLTLFRVVCQTYVFYERLSICT